jgi:hypothetical protein
MACLNDIQIQALADGEGTDEMRAHAASCDACAGRVRERAALVAQMAAELALPALQLPASVAVRLQAEATGPEKAARMHDGATRLRAPLTGSLAPRWLYGALGVAAATIAAILFVAPAVRQADTTVSAAEILAKSATQLAAAPSAGVEVLEYELVMDGVPKELVPDQVDGAYRIWQAIDHGVPGRFRLASYTPDGRMFSSIAEDPVAGRRVAAFTAEGQPYRFDVTLPKDARNLSLPEMQRLHMQASIAMMQASGNQLLETLAGPNGTLYRIEVPRVSGPGTNPVWDLSEARVVIDSRDYTIVEFAVRGAFLKQDYSMSYKLLKHVTVASLEAGAFAVPNQPGEIVISGEGTSVPSQDVFLLSLRELTKLKRGQ